MALARGAAELGSDIAVLDVLEKPVEAFYDFEKELGVKARYYRFVSGAVHPSVRVVAKTLPG